jgi:hypothetical protein
MRTSEQINEIAGALALAQSEMKNAKFNRTNPHFKSRYADLSEIRDTVTPALTKNGIAVVQGTDITESGIIVFTRLVHKSGQWFESVFPIANDKPQAMGSSISYGRRYTLSAITSIAADDDDDAEVASGRTHSQTIPARMQEMPKAVESVGETYVRKFNEAETAEAFEDEVTKARAAWSRFNATDKTKVANSIEARRAFWAQSPAVEAAE